jgi:hypothetical protein
VRVVHHRRLDLTDPAEVDPEVVLEALRSGTGDMVVVVAGDGSIEVVPVAG